MEDRGGGAARAGARQGGAQEIDGGPEVEEGDFLLGEVDRRVNDFFAGKREVSSHSSGAEYLRYVRKMLDDDALEG